MDNFRLLDGLATIIVGIIGWFVKETRQNHKELSKEVTDLKVELAKDYVPNDRLEVIVKAMSEDIKYIRQKLDSK